MIVLRIGHTNAERTGCHCRTTSAAVKKRLEATRPTRHNVLGIQESRGAKQLLRRAAERSREQAPDEPTAGDISGFRPARAGGDRLALRNLTPALSEVFTISRLDCLLDLSEQGMPEERPRLVDPA
jgi:hypothetical protein